MLASAAATAGVAPGYPPGEAGKMLIKRDEQVRLGSPTSVMGGSSLPF